MWIDNHAKNVRAEPRANNSDSVADADPRKVNYESREKRIELQTRIRADVNPNIDYFLFQRHYKWNLKYFPRSVKSRSIFARNYFKLIQNGSGYIVKRLTCKCKGWIRF